MLTQPRVLGYVFNPLSVLLVPRRRPARSRAVVAEVHNTYGGRHRYLLRPGRIPPTGTPRTGKEFYVSPFFPVDGEYRMRLPEPAARLNVADQSGRERRTAVHREPDRRPAFRSPRRRWCGWRCATRCTPW